MNPQGYAGANPVMNTDPSGLRFAPDEGLGEQGGGYGRTGDLTPDDGFDSQAYYSPQNEEVYPDPDPDPTPPAANGDPAADAAPPAAGATADSGGSSSAGEVGGSKATQHLDDSGDAMTYSAILAGGAAYLAAANCMSDPGSPTCAAAPKLVSLSRILAAGAAAANTLSVAVSCRSQSGEECAQRAGTWALAGLIEATLFGYLGQTFPAGGNWASDSLAEAVVEGGGRLWGALR